MSKRVLAPLIVFLLISCRPASESSTSSNQSAAPTTTGNASNMTLTNASIQANQPLSLYKFWQLDPTDAVNVHVALKGQFDDDSPWSAKVLDAKLIGNPAAKEQPRATSPLHYVAYAVAPDSPRPTPPPVAVTNELGTKVHWQLGAPTFLLVPADKSLTNPTDSKQSGDHFVCYAAHGEPMPTEMTVHDEFDDVLKAPETFKRLTPAYLCVPVSKKVGTRPTEEVTDAKTHLALYAIGSGPKFGQPIWTNDQFQHLKFMVGYSQLLGLPSEKEVLEPQKQKSR